MKSYLDKIAYVDWDLFAEDEMRQKLEKFYRFRNKELLKYISKGEIPERYLNS